MAIEQNPMPHSATEQLFSKTLSQTDVDVRLSFPMKVLKDFEFHEGKDMVEFEVTDSVGKSWNFGLTKRNRARHRYSKPVLSSGWLSYVRDKGLRKNVRVILSIQITDKAKKTRFKIQAQRKTTFKLFGKVIKDVEDWVDIEEWKPYQVESAPTLCMLCSAMTSAEQSGRNESFHTIIDVR